MQSLPGASPGFVSGSGRQQMEGNVIQNVVLKQHLQENQGEGSKFPWGCTSSVVNCPPLSELP